MIDTPGCVFLPENNYLSIVSCDVRITVYICRLIAIFFHAKSNFYLFLFCCWDELDSCDMWVFIAFMWFYQVSIYWVAWLTRIFSFCVELNWIENKPSIVIGLSREWVEVMVFYWRCAIVVSIYYIMIISTTWTQRKMYYN